jgi:hypothetical protein
MDVQRNSMKLRLEEEDDGGHRTIRVKKRPQPQVPPKMGSQNGFHPNSAESPSLGAC